MNCVLMKKSIFFAVVLSGLVGMTFFSACNSQSQGTGGAPASANAPASVAGSGTRIVYINTDTLMNKYLFAVELNEKFLKKQEERRTELNVKAKSLDQEATEFQRKLENNGLQEDMIAEAAREQSELNKQLFDKLTNFLKVYNQERGFDIVLSTQLGGNVLFAVEGFDITNDVVKRLNEEYNKEKGQ